MPPGTDKTGDANHGIWLPGPVLIVSRQARSERLVWSRTLLWYETVRSRPLLLVIVRDPAGHQRDDYFITSDTTLTSRRRSRHLFRSLGNRRRGDAPK
jgi:hypothetical protein